MSPGTSMSRAPEARPDPSIGGREARPGATGAPSQASSRSVWSRVGPGVVMVVRPSAASAARVTAPSTWALATGRSWCSGAQRPRAPDGHRARARRPSTTVAPIWRSGTATRSMGRPDSDASPIWRAAAARPARAPSSSRMLVPELP